MRSVDLTLQSRFLIFLRTSFGSRVGFTRTLRTHPKKFQSMPDNFKIGRIDLLRINLEIGYHRRVGDAIASNATDMRMFRWVAVKTLQGAAGFKLLDITGFGKDLKIAINRPQTDARQALAHHFIDFIRAWMGIDLAKLFQNHFALPRHPQIR